MRLLDTHGVRYGVIGGQAVNSEVEPLVSLDLGRAFTEDLGNRLENARPGRCETGRRPLREAPAAG